MFANFETQNFLTNIQGALMSDEKISKIDRQIEMLFLEVEEGITNLREAIARRGEKHGSFCWLSFWARCDKQHTKLFLEIYKSEVSFRHPEINPNEYLN
jgi:hypothetical protein